MSSMYELLMELPLFKGVSHARLSEIVGAAKFHFLKYPEGEKIVRAGDPCDHLTFVISGRVRSTVTNTSNRFSVSQILTAPAVLAPDFLFGRLTEYPADVIAVEPAGILKISKTDYINILGKDPVFMFNYLNALSVNAQRGLHGLLCLSTGSLDERLAYWIISLTQPGGTDITMTCTTHDLCTLFGVQRSIFTSVMNKMAEDGLISYTNKQVRVHDRRAILALLEHTAVGKE